METACVRINKGSGFFAAKNYIVTCRHVLMNRPEIGDCVEYYFKSTPFEARIEDVDEKKDLILLQAVTAPNTHRSLKLDRVAVLDTSVTVYGYPNNSGVQRSARAKVGQQDEQGHIALHDANDTTLGYSGGPVCPNAMSDYSIGVFYSIMEPDGDLRETGLSSMIAASDLLDLWGDRLEEARYTVAANKRNDFVYNSLQTDYIDVDNNLQKLEDYANDSRSVLWWSVVAEGGSGKSRLAYEFAHALPSTWRCHLLRPDGLKVSNLDKLYESASRNMLIISDYAYTDTEELGLWLEHVTAPENRKQYPYKIRVLLLQRYGNSEKDRAPLPWRQTLLCGHRSLEEYRYKDEDLILKKLDKLQLIEIMRSFAEKNDYSLETSIYDNLYDALLSIDRTLTRPLFAMFIIDAFLREASPEKWDIKEKALDHFSRRELSMLESAIQKKPDDLDMAITAEKLWVLATITNGYMFTEEALPSVTAEIGMALSPSKLGRKLYCAHYAKQANKTWTMKPMTPDILGEFFVLKYFQDNPPLIHDFLNVAYQNNPDNTSDFIERMFCDHATNTDMITSCCEAIPSIVFAIALGLYLRISTQTDVQEKRRVFSQLEDIYKQHSANAEVALLYSKRLMINFMLQPDHLGKRSVLDKLNAVYDQNQNKIDIVIVYAQVLYYYYSFIHQIDSDEKAYVFDKLRDVYTYEKNYRNSEIAKRFALALHLQYVAADSFEKKEDALDQLEAVYDQHPDNDDIANIHNRDLLRHIRSDEWRKHVLGK